MNTAQHFCFESRLFTLHRRQEQILHQALKQEENTAFTNKIVEFLAEEGLIY